MTSAVYISFFLTLFMCNFIFIGSFTVQDRKEDNFKVYRQYSDSNDTEECLKQMAETDACVGRALFLSQERRPLPNTIDDINEYCR